MKRPWIPPKPIRPLQRVAFNKKFFNLKTFFAARRRLEGSKQISVKFLFLTATRFSFIRKETWSNPTWHASGQLQWSSLVRTKQTHIWRHIFSSFWSEIVNSSIALKWRPRPIPKRPHHFLETTSINQASTNGHMWPMTSIWGGHHLVFGPAKSDSGGKITFANWQKRIFHHTTSLPLDSHWAVSICFGAKKKVNRLVPSGFRAVLSLLWSTINKSQSGDKSHERPRRTSNAISRRGENPTVHFCLAWRWFTTGHIAAVTCIHELAICFHSIRDESFYTTLSTRPPFIERLIKLQSSSRL